MIRFPTIVIAGLVVTACATGQRQEPAPVVQVTPREPVTAAPAALPEPEKPVAPKKQQTRVFAYQDPAAEPDPEPEPQSEPAPVPAPAAAASPPVAPGAAPGVAQTPAQPPRSSSPAPKPAPKPAPSQAQTAPPAAAPATPKSPAASPPTPKVAQAPKAPDPKPPEPRPPEPRPQSTPRASEPAPAAAPSAPPPRVAAAAPAPALAAPGLPPAADALARQAEQQRQSGDYAGAAASLERSLRIAPREAYLWNRLARVRLEQGQAAQAGNLAARSNDLAGDTPTIKQDNWRIIAESKRRAGDMAGAGDAERRASGN